MLRRQSVFTTENTKFTEIFKEAFSVLFAKHTRKGTVHSVVKLYRVN